MSQIIPYTGVMSKGNHESSQTEESDMGNDGRMLWQRHEVVTAESRRGAREALPALTRGITAGGERQDLAALERYLQIPTFRRQGRRLSCR